MATVEYTSGVRNALSSHRNKISMQNLGGGRTPEGRREEIHEKKSTSHFAQQYRHTIIPTTMGPLLVFS